jgi:hydrogenase-4 component F
MILSVFQLFLIIGIVAMGLVLLSRSHRAMNWVSLLHAVAYLALAVYALVVLQLPLQSGDYFFMDHLSAYEIIITSVVFFLATLYLEGYIKALINTNELPRKNLKFFYVVTNLLLIVMAFSFLSNDLALFWIFVELTTLFSAVLVVTLNAKENIDAALKYIFIASTAMLFSFIGLILLYFLAQNALGAGTLSWSVLMQNATAFSPKLLAVSFLFIFIGFAAKSGIAPFHTWLPHTYSKAPSAVSVILSAAVVNVGVYGILRVFAIVHQTAAVTSVSWFLIGFGTFSVAIASLNMLRQLDTKKLIAFSSIEHMGIILIGIGIATRTSIFWSIAYILAHALAKSLLFFCAGIINRQYESNEAADVRNIMKLQPLASLGMVIGSLAIVGMPPFILFLPKILLLVELSKVSLALFLVLMLFLTIVLAAFGIFMTRIFAAVSEPKQAEKMQQFAVPTKMSVTVIILIVLVIGLGVFFPSHLQGLIDTIVSELRF